MINIIKTIHSAISRDNNEDLYGVTGSFDPKVSAVSWDIAHGLDIHHQRERLRATINIVNLIRSFIFWSWIFVVILLISRNPPSLDGNATPIMPWGWKMTTQVFAVPLVFNLTSEAFTMYIQGMLINTFPNYADKLSPTDKLATSLARIKWWQRDIFIGAWLLLGFWTITFLWPFWSSLIKNLSSNILYEKWLSTFEIIFQ